MNNVEVNVYSCKTLLWILVAIFFLKKDTSISKSYYEYSLTGRGKHVELRINVTNTHEGRTSL